jgi:hypothetical protein
MLIVEVPALRVPERGATDGAPAVLAVVSGGALE